MSAMNHDIQASHKILQLIERSKRESDKFLDTIPGIFAVINEDADIIRGNQTLAEYFGLDQELLLHKCMKSVFQEPEFEIFQSHVKKLIDGERAFLDFELSMTNHKGVSTPHLWYLSVFDPKQTGGIQLITVVGKNISDLKEAQQNLLEIFSSVPLGILTIGDKGIVQGEFSKYFEIILGTDTIAGETIDTLMFSKLHGLKKQEQEALDGLIEAVGNNQMVYEIMAESLPKKAYLEIDGDQKWLSLNYQPIAYDSIVRKVLIIIEDITELVKAEELKKKNSILEEKSVSRIVQLKKIEQETFDVVFEEFDELFENLSNAGKAKEISKVKNYLHGIKGCSRVAGLDFLAEESHQCESKIIEMDGDENLNSSLDGLLKPVLEEWNEISSLVKALFAKGDKPVSKKSDNELGSSFKGLFQQYNELLRNEKNIQTNLAVRKVLVELESLTKVPINTLEDFVKSNVVKTADSLSKRVDLDFNWDGVYIDKIMINTIKECLMHMSNNSIDHGIEVPAVRKKMGKNESGTIHIEAGNDVNQLRIRFWDDGAGFNIEKIRNLAIEKGFVDVETGVAMRDEEIVKFIFEDGFSSADSVSIVSGRGVGLSSVKQEIEELKGSIKVSCYNQTAYFDIALPGDGGYKEQKRIIPLNEFFEDLDFQIKKLNNNNRTIIFEIDQDLMYNKDNYSLFAIPEMLLFSVVELLDLLVLKGSETLKLEALGDGLVQVSVPLSEQVEVGNYILDTCSMYLSKHNGKYIVEDGLLKIKFGYINKNLT